MVVKYTHQYTFLYRSRCHTKFLYNGTWQKSPQARSGLALTSSRFMPLHLNLVRRRRKSIERQMLIALIIIVSSYREKRRQWIRTVGTGASILSKSKKQYIEDAISYYKEQRYREALEAFEQAIQIDPDCVKALHGRGAILTQMKEYKKALESYEQAFKLAPHIAKIHLDMAEVSGLHYKKAVELDRSYETGYRNKTQELFYKAGELRFHGQRDEAIAAFQAILLFDPAHEGAKQALSELQNTRTSVTYSSSYFDDFYSYQSQPSRSQPEREAMENNQWDLRPSIHPANCRCAQCWEP